MARAPVVYFYGPSGSGKTRLVERLVSELSLRGWRVATVKRTSHEALDVDTEGKDTWRHAKAGASAVAATSRTNSFVMVPRGLPSSALVEAIEATGGVDIILVEGLGDDAPPAAPKVAVGEVKERASGTVLAVAGKEADIDAVVDVLERLRATHAGRPEAVELLVGGRSVLMKPFVQEFLEGTLRGAVSALDGAGTPQDEVVLRLPPRGTGKGK
jgi:molybdopterin-guanine dinucleotide biosynthesis protein B